jgi:hypothetical protein
MLLSQAKGELRLQRTLDVHMQLSLGQAEYKLLIFLQAAVTSLRAWANWTGSLYRTARNVCKCAPLVVTILT